MGIRDKGRERERERGREKWKEASRGPVTRRFLIWTRTHHG